MTSADELFALQIEAWRNQAAGNAARAMLNADRPLDEVQQAASVARVRWELEHPGLLAQLGGAA